MLDAYSIRKAAPRLLMAVIGINLSIYLCVGAIDLTNVIGRGLVQLITDPFINANTFQSLNVEASAENNVLGILGMGGVLGGAIGLVMINGAGGAILAVLGFLLPLIITIALITLAVLFTLVIRTGLLIFLTILSPIAIACFVLPGTEKYFQKWMDLFARTLLFYPAVAALFAVSNVMAAILLNSAGAGAGIMFGGNVPVFAQAALPDGVATSYVLAAILCLFAPLVLIPFVYKLLGGVIGAIGNAASGRASSLAGRTNKRIEQSKQNPNGMFYRRRQEARDKRIQARSDTYGSLQDRASRTGRVRGGLYRGAARVVGGHNIEAQASAAREEKNKQIQGQIATGRDEEIRGLTANMSAAQRDWNQGGPRKQEFDADGKLTSETSANGLMRKTGDGTVQYRSLGGAWVDDAKVRAGQARWGKNTFAQQAALSYEMRKAAKDEDVARISTNFPALATESWGMSAPQAEGAFIGAGFENQGTHLEFKHMRMDKESGKLELDSKSFATEIYEKKGSYPLSQMSAHTFHQLREAHRSGDTDTKRMVEGVAETFMTRYGGGGGIANVTEDGQPIPAAAGVPGQPSGGSFQTNAPGAAHVAEAARQLAVDVGVYRPLDSSDPSNTGSGVDNTAGRPRQN